jgi:hypothetical protein
MAQRVWARARLVYGVHLLVTSVALFIAWHFASSLAPLASQFHDFLAHPVKSALLAPALLHQPPLFDILPLYVIFLCATPWLLATARRHGWLRVLAVSALGWVAAQVQSHFLPDLAGILKLQLGSFNIAAWQFLWIAGLALGEGMLRGDILRRGKHEWLASAAAVIVTVGFVCRHGIWPQAWFPDSLYLWMDKWTLGPLRLLNFGAWVIVLMWWNPKVPRFLTAPFALLGRNSLSVFAFHLPLVIAAGTAIELFTVSRGVQIAIGLAVIAALFPWAVWQEFNRERERSAASQPAPEPVLAEAFKPVEELAGMISSALETPTAQQ